MSKKEKWSRHSTPDSLIARGWHEKAYIRQTPLHLGEPVYSQETSAEFGMQQWNRDRSASSFPLMFLQGTVVMVDFTFPPAVTAEVPGSQRWGTRNPFISMGHSWGDMFLELMVWWWLLNPRSIQSLRGLGATGRVCGFLTRAREQLLWEACPGSHSCNSAESPPTALPVVL